MQVHALSTLIEPVVRGAGLVFVGVEWVNQPGCPTLRVYVERPGGACVVVDECATLSRELSPLLDVEGGLSGRYFLEVSSPGMDRLLWTVADYERFIGSEVKVTVRPVLSQTRRVYKGTLLAVNQTAGQQSIDIQVDGLVHSLLVERLEKGRIIPDFSKALQKTREADKHE